MDCTRLPTTRLPTTAWSRRGSMVGTCKVDGGCGTAGARVSCTPVAPAALAPSKCEVPSLDHRRAMTLRELPAQHTHIIHLPTPQGGRDRSKDRGRARPMALGDGVARMCAVVFVCQMASRFMASAKSLALKSYHGTYQQASPTPFHHALPINPLASAHVTAKVITGTRTRTRRCRPHCTRLSWAQCSPCSDSFCQGWSADGVTAPEKRRCKAHGATHPSWHEKRKYDASRCLTIGAGPCLHHGVVCRPIDAIHVEPPHWYPKRWARLA